MNNKEHDVRQDRYESEFRYEDMAELSKKNNDGRLPKIYKCSNCDRIFAERSIHCPYCQSKTMGEIKSIRHKQY